ncbi:hypothetical protein MKW94_008600 [Papaver nudicaule]|uniref:Uncharacterized protein n=1 Tax=Papaver nudicaule TaxID=74823 RepID=A0AA41S0S7_PAPNU|nr:hypothetical protein [Papaver nudicaule]
MANGFRGFGRMLSTAKNSTREEGLVGRMLSTAKNSTRKEGFGGRMFSSDAGKNSTKISKDAAAPVKLTAAERTKRINREVDLYMLKSIAAGVVPGLFLSYCAYRWNPFEDTLEGGKDYEVIRIQGLLIKKKDKDRGVLVLD